MERSKKQPGILIPHKNHEVISAVIKEEHEQQLTGAKKITDGERSCILASDDFINEKFLEKSNAVPHYILQS